MATDILMPKLGLTMEEATILEWLVEDGTDVAVDQPILRIETDKAEKEVGSPDAGRVHRVGRPGEVYPCGHLIGWLLAGSETPPVTAATPGAPPALRNHTSPTTPGQTPAVAPIGARPGAGVVATAAARNLADLLGVDLALVPADPRENRVTRDGVAHYVRGQLQRLAPSAPSAHVAPTGAAVRSGPAADAPTAGPARPGPLLQEPSGIVPLSGMRGAIARRMHASLRDMAQLTLTMDTDLTAVVADRARRRADVDGGRPPSITDYVVAATARALLLHSRLNAQVTPDGIALLPEVHVGLAVAVEGGLVVPVIRHAARCDLADLAAETFRLATAARAGTLTMADREGATFCVTALSAQGVDTFTPVINPPNAGILGIGRLRDDPVVVDGPAGRTIGTVPRLTLSLTWDHRVVDGVPAADFCRSVVALLADPARLDLPVD